MNDLNQVMQLLSWENDAQTQLEGRKYAQKIDDISIFIQPENYGGKAVWENCAIILSEKTDRQLEPYLNGMLEWLQDINWPGAMIILQRLKIFSGKLLKHPLEDIVIKATEISSEEYLMWLDYLSELIDNKELVANLSQEVLNLLKAHYHNWARWYNN